MRYIFFFFLLCQYFSLCSQPLTYTTRNAHSHNDYEQKVPFFTAYNESFGSIEADIFLQNDSLYIAHDTEELKLHRTLREYYLEPLVKLVMQNGGHPYKEASKPLQMLIDLKTDSINTLTALVHLLEQYPSLTNASSLQFVITGNRPDQSLFTSYPSFIWFDGELWKDYSKEALTRIVMLSDNLRIYSQWNGKNKPPENEWIVLAKAVGKAHSLGKKVRFWNAPDFSNAWYQFMRLGVDYINTDHIVALSSFLKNLPKNK